MTAIRSLVCSQLARHLDCSEAAIHPWQHLERDLDLTPLELVLVVLEIEELEDVEIPIEGLEGATTVGDLVSFLSRNVRREATPRVGVA